MCHVYILKSTVSQQYYVGYTCDDLLARISKHNRPHKGFTGRNQPWLLVYSEQLQTKQLALKREQEIKAWKSSVLIEKLILSVH
jgi:putative endonuclease